MKFISISVKCIYNFFFRYFMKLQKIKIYIETYELNFKDNFLFFTVNIFRFYKYNCKMYNYQNERFKKKQKKKMADLLTDRQTDLLTDRQTDLLSYLRTK